MEIITFILYPTPMRISEPINVWNNAKDGTIAYTLNHDDTVTMTQWGGKFISIRDSSGREGWVPYYNIQELKLRSYN